MRSSGVPIDGRAAAFGAALGDLVEQVPRVLDVRRRPGRPSTRTLYSLCQRCRPCTASRRACSLVSAMCQLISTRQSRRSTVVPCAAAASSANAHCVGSACRPSALVEAIDSTPMPYLPAICMPLGLMLDAVAIGMSLLDRQDLQRGLVQREPVAVVAETLLAVEQADDHAHRLVLAIAQQHRADAHRARVAAAARRARCRTSPGPWSCGRAARSAGRR